MAETCNPKPPIACGVPNNLAFLRLLQCSSCTVVPALKPNKVTCSPACLEIRQLSLPPPPITVGDIADITGEGLAAPAAL